MGASFRSLSSIVVAAAAVIACGSFREGTDTSLDAGATPTNDAGDPVDGCVPSPDDGAGPDAAPPCRLLVNDSFADPNLSATRWRRLGAAKFIDGEVELVPNLLSSAGAIWMNVDNPQAGVIRATFTTKIAPSSTGADGLAFVWSATPDPELGGNAGNYGACGGGANGLAVILETFAEDLRLVNVTNTCPNQAGKQTDVFGTHLVSVVAEPSTVTVDLSGTKFTFTAPRAVVPRAIGFTAATGGLSTRHAVDDVRVELCAE